MFSKLPRHTMADLAPLAPTEQCKSTLLRPPVTLQLRAGDHVAFPSLGPTFKGSNATAEQTDLANPSHVAKGVHWSYCNSEARRLGTVRTCQATYAGRRWGVGHLHLHLTCRLLFSVHTFTPNNASTPARAQAYPTVAACLRAQSHLWETFVTGPRCYCCGVLRASC